ncbi:MAG: hypothetical protein ACI97A_000175 [Planctomycetota bacterium]|jgi:hypothetical protein
MDGLRHPSINADYTSKPVVLEFRKEVIRGMRDRLHFGTDVVFDPQSGKLLTHLMMEGWSKFSEPSKPRITCDQKGVSVGDRDGDHSWGCHHDDLSHLSADPYLGGDRETCASNPLGPKAS